MVRYVKNEGRPALGFAVESDESDESSDDEPLSDQPSLATLVSETPGSPPDSQAPFVPKSERRRSASRVSFKEDMAFVDRQGYTRDSENLVRLRGCFGLGRALLFALFCFRLDLGLRGSFSLCDRFLAVLVFQTLYILYIDDT